MKKLFISQAIDGKTKEELLQIRQKAINDVKDVFGEDVKLIDSLVTDTPQGCPTIWYVGQSLILLARADVVYFPKGWQESNVCTIHNTLAIAYGLLVIEEN